MSNRTGENFMVMHLKADAVKAALQKQGTCCFLINGLAFFRGLNATHAHRRPHRIRQGPHDLMPGNSARTDKNGEGREGQKKGRKVAERTKRARPLPCNIRMLCWLAKAIQPSLPDK